MADGYVRGDIFRAYMAGDDRKLATYEVLTVFPNGTVWTFNVKTGLERSFLPSELEAAES